jgi:hypothetical protein
MRCMILAAISVTGCTSWGSSTVYGPKQEIGRQLLGSPAIEQSSSSSLSAGFLGSRSSYDGRRVHDGIAAGNLDASTESTKLTHCVQQAEIHYVQPYDVVPVPSGRYLDVAGGVALVLVGGMIMAIAEARSETIFSPGDPLYTPPPSATPGLVVGGGAMLAGAGLLAYSFGSLPKSPRPAIEHASREFVETEYVEATGCGLPGDPATATR